MLITYIIIGKQEILQTVSKMAWQKSDFQSI
jgi:hypothetical protein